MKALAFKSQPEINGFVEKFVIFFSDQFTSQFNEDFTQNYNKENDEGYFLESDIQYSKKLHELHNNLPFLPERMKIEKVERLVSNVHDQTEYAIHIRNLKQILNHGLILKILIERLNLIKNLG